MVDKIAYESTGGIKEDPQTRLIIGAAMEVHKRLGPGFLEQVYHEALAIELAHRNIPFQREVEIPIYYCGEPLSCAYRVDFVCFNEIIVEIKALQRLSNIEVAQVINYLRATDMHRGLLLNFGETSLRIRRFAHEYKG